jgi:hypothetical protein
MAAGEGGGTLDGQPIVQLLWFAMIASWLLA